MARWTRCPRSPNCWPPAPTLDRRAGRPPAAPGRRVAAAVRSRPSPTCCCGCRSRCRRPRPAACRLPVRRPVPARRPGRRPTSTTRSASCCAASGRRRCGWRYTEAPDLPRGRPGLGRRPADPARGDPGAASASEVDRRARPRRQPGQRPHARASSSWSTCRARPTSPAMVADGTFPGRRRPRARRAPGRGSATAWSASSRTARSSTPARTRCRRSAGWASPATCSASRSTTLTSTVADDPFDASDLAAAVADGDRRRPAGQHRGRRRRARPCCSARCRCARAARRSARCC